VPDPNSLLPATDLLWRPPREASWGGPLPGPSTFKSISELTHSYWFALGDAKPYLILWAVLLILWASPSVTTWWGRQTRGRQLWLLSGGVLIALVWAWHLASCFDDAFISFRYARNLARGEGLVWNPGEHVEGYTNFLWTLLVAGVFWLGLPGPTVAVLLCLACFAGELLLVARMSRLLAPAEEPSRISIAAVLVGCNYIVACYGTSGMETMFATLLVTLAVERAMCQRPGQAGIAGVAAVMAHPDLGIFYLSLGLAIVFGKGLRRKSWLYAVPFALLYVPYFAWRWHYYGDPFPNTFYAKSGDLAYFGQGALYLAASAMQTGAWVLIPFAAIACWRHRDTLIARHAMISIPVYFFYLAKIGGDFMLGRLFVPAMPLLALLAERAIRDLLRENRPAIAQASLASLALVAAPVHLIEPGTIVYGLADETSFYRLSSVLPLRLTGETFQGAELLRDALAGTGIRPVMAFGSIGFLGYTTELPLLDIRGLTDRTVAHSPLGERGRPGHEKHATAAYLRSREVELSQYPLYDARHARLTGLSLNGFVLYLARYSPPLIRALKGHKEIKFTRFENYLDEYLGTMARDLTPAEIESDARFFEDYYFSCNDDPVRKARVETLLSRAAPSQPSHREEVAVSAGDTATHARSGQAGMVPLGSKR
jgi:arabinofuranosyltransferase